MTSETIPVFSRYMKLLLMKGIQRASANSAKDIPANLALSGTKVFGLLGIISAASVLLSIQTLQYSIVQVRAISTKGSPHCTQVGQYSSAIIAISRFPLQGCTSKSIPASALSRKKTPTSAHLDHHLKNNSTFFLSCLVKGTTKLQPRTRTVNSIQTPIPIILRIASMCAFPF